MKNKSKLFSDLGEMLKPLTDKEKKALIKEATDPDSGRRLQSAAEFSNRLKALA